VNFLRYHIESAERTVDTEPIAAGRDASEILAFVATSAMDRCVARFEVFESYVFGIPGNVRFSKYTVV